MMRLMIAGLAILAPSTALAQASKPAKTFKVATIKPTDPNFGGILVGFPGGTLSLRGFTIKDIVGLAYDVDNRQIFNVPKALESAKYDVVASDGPALLAEHFQLQFHKETREVPVYVMRTVKSGYTVKPRTEGDGGAPMSLLFQGANCRPAMSPPHCWPLACKRWWSIDRSSTRRASPARWTRPSNSSLRAPRR